MSTPVRWNVKVSREVDLSLRALLNAQGLKRGSLSKFVEESVRWRIFDRAVQDLKLRNADISPQELQSIINDAARKVRTQQKPRTRSSK